MIRFGMATATLGACPICHLPQRHWYGSKPAFPVLALSISAPSRVGWDLLSGLGQLAARFRALLAMFLCVFLQYTCCGSTAWNSTSHHRQMTRITWWPVSCAYAWVFRSCTGRSMHSRLNCQRSIGARETGNGRPASQRSGSLGVPVGVGVDCVVVLAICRIREPCRVSASPSTRQHVRGCGFEGLGCRPN